MFSSGVTQNRPQRVTSKPANDKRGFTGGYQSVKRFVRKLLGSTSKEACAVIQTAPGEEAQVDYGTGPMARDPVSGKYRRMRLFVLTSAIAASRSASWSSNPARRLGPSCMRGPSAAWVAAHAL
jgi:hypothetical protein